MTREYVVFSRIQYSVIKEASIKNNIICVFIIIILVILFLPKQTVTSPEPDTYLKAAHDFHPVISVEVDDEVDSI